MEQAVEGEYVSIEDPTVHRDVEPKKKWWSFKINMNQIVSGLSMMGTDYNLFVINMALVVLKAEDKEVYFFLLTVLFLANLSNRKFFNGNYVLNWSSTWTVSIWLCWRLDW